MDLWQDDGPPCSVGYMGEFADGLLLDMNEDFLGYTQDTAAPVSGSSQDRKRYQCAVSSEQ
jgi:hypothetical protein